VIDPRIIEKEKLKIALYLAYQSAVVNAAYATGSRVSEFLEATLMIPSEDFRRLRDSYSEQLRKIEEIFPGGETGEAINL
jgi:hypothetical protein